MENTSRRQDSNQREPLIKINCRLETKAQRQQPRGNSSEAATKPMAAARENSQRLCAEIAHPSACERQQPEMRSLEAVDKPKKAGKDTRSETAARENWKQ